MFYVENHNPKIYCRFVKNTHDKTKKHKENLKIMNNTIDRATKNKLNRDVINNIMSYL